MNVILLICQVFLIDLYNLSRFS